ncbi:MAG: hypothetical protein UZ14_CFX002000242 [Chloroflexi bacterium OLB14]|nr:MAG: hypothetical protein UZ14_CFX002000242 [Chloroflexi bacterium OLB14]
MQVKISSIFPIKPELAWQEVQKTKLLHYVGSPLIKFIPARETPFTELWQTGEYIVDMKLFGLLPFGKQIIGIKPPPEHEQKQHQFSILDDGRGELIKTWRHLITVDKVNAEKTLYADEVEVQAGVLTFFVWLFANIFFWHRQRRWKKLIRNNFNYQ